MNRLRAAIILVSLVIGISVMSAGYALWSKTLTITGTVNTGNVSIEWIQGTAGDSEPSGKDVSGITCTVMGDNLQVTVTNAYPAVTYECTFSVHGNGSVPVHLDDVVWDPAPPDNFHLSLEWTDATSAVIDDLDCVQLHYCQSIYGKLTLQLDNSVVNGINTYTFGGSLTANQYNEDEIPASCFGGPCDNNHTPTVDVYLPAGGETFYVHQNMLVEWTMSDLDGIAPAGSPLPGGPLTVYVDLSSDSGVDGYPCRIHERVVEVASLDDIYQYTWYILSLNEIQAICPGFNHISEHNQVKVTVIDPCGGTFSDTTPDFCPLEACPVEGCDE